MVKKLLIVLFVCNFALLNASQEDVKVSKENQKKTFIPNDNLLKRAATATQVEKNNAAAKASTEKEYGEVEFWIEQGANAEGMFALGCLNKNAPTVAIALRHGVDIQKDTIIEIVKGAFILAGEDIVDLFLSDPRVDLENDNRIAGTVTLIQGAAMRGDKALSKRLLFLGIKPTMSNINLKRGEDGIPAESCAYEWALTFGHTEVARMIEKAHKGDFSFISDEERKHFTAIATKRMRMQSKNVFNHLRAREIGRKTVPSPHLLKVAKKEANKDIVACGNALEKLSTKGTL
jgi:hypothetical protein